MDNGRTCDGKRVGRAEIGPTFVEYGLLVTLLGIACLVAVSFMGMSLRDVFAHVAGSV